MAVTIKDVAAAAGVSPSTVSRTCKDSPSISRETKERVRRIMAQLGYEPNFEAEPVEAFSKTIGIILPSSQRDVYENAFHLEIIRGIGQFCNQRRYVNTVITGQDDAEVLDAIQSMVANAQADGFILLYKLIKGRFFSIKDGSYNSIQTNILQYILNNIINAVITHALTNNIQLYQ